jgi:hypothetical protein
MFSVMDARESSASWEALDGMILDQRYIRLANADARPRLDLTWHSPST